MAIATVNPATGKTERTFDELSDAGLEARIQSAADCARRYPYTSFTQRAQWMRAAADLLDAERDQIAATMTREMGKTLASARAEAAKCATGMRYYAEHAEAFLADEPADASAVGAARAFARYEPLGVVLAVMPWNFPLWQAVRFAAPALMAGNVGLLKHASNVPQSALYLGDLFERAGFPAGAFQTLLISARRVERVLRDPRVAAVTLTGSEDAGRAVGRVAGEALKKAVLELGGSDPFLVLPSADVARAAEVATVARCQNNGQSCIAAKRFIVHEDVYEDFAARLVERMSALVVGDPADGDTQLGPLATEQGRTEVEDLVADAVTRGASVLCGGRRPERDGWFYPATVLADVTAEMRVFHEELFGPVAVLYRVGSLDEALAVANATRFGLGSNAWTRDEAEAERCQRELQAGAVFVNGMTTSYPQLPFGGIKASGFGRELSAQGIREFCNVKTIWAAA
ncbi:MAG: NADP-dependent succinic semialdehyde dehydrogenase [Actinocrinis sp.]